MTRSPTKSLQEQATWQNDWGCGLVKQACRFQDGHRRDAATSETARRACRMEEFSAFFAAGGEPVSDGTDSPNLDVEFWTFR